MTAIRKNSNTGLLLGVCSGISEWTYQNAKLIKRDGGWQPGMPAWSIRTLWCLSLVFFVLPAVIAYVYLANTLSDTAECTLPDEDVK